MYTFPAAVSAALAADTAILGYFVSLGAQQSGGTIAWHRYSDQPIDVTLSGNSYPRANSLIKTVDVTDRRTVNLGGGRRGMVELQDSRRSIFDRHRSLSPLSSRVQVDISLFHNNTWTAPLRLFTGHVSSTRWDAQSGAVLLSLAGRFQSAKPPIIVATDADQRKRSSDDVSLQQVGKQLYLNWTG